MTHLHHAPQPPAGHATDAPPASTPPEPIPSAHGPYSAEQAHRYDGDTDRCVCGGEIVYFEYRETSSGVVEQYDGYGCAVDGKAYRECCESTPRLGHSADCDAQAAMDHAVVTDVYRTEYCDGEV